MVGWMKFQCWGSGKTIVPHPKKESCEEEIFNEKFTLFLKYVVFGVQIDYPGRSVMEEKCGTLPGRVIRTSHR